MKKIFVILFAMSALSLLLAGCKKDDCLGAPAQAEEAAPALEIRPENLSGLLPLELKFLPEPMRAETKLDDSEPFAFRFQGAAYALGLKIGYSDPEARRVVLRDFKLIGKLEENKGARLLVPASGPRVRAGSR